MAGGQRKRTLGMMMDQQFEFQHDASDWREQGVKQNVLGSDLITHYPVEEVSGQPKNVEFHLVDQDQVWAMGPNTRFVVMGQFQVMTPAKGEEPWVPWATCTDEEVDKCIVAPNWFES